MYRRLAVEVIRARVQDLGGAIYGIKGKKT